MKLKVFNKGTRTRYRLGVGFPPKKEVEIEVSKRDYLTIKAVRDFEVMILEDSKEQNAQISPGNGPISGDIDLSELNISEVVKLVEEGKMKPEEAIAKEVAGKNRQTLIEKLEKLKEKEKEGE